MNRWYKLFPDKIDVLNNYDITIYLDGNCSLRNTGFINLCISNLENSDMLLFKHPHRSCIYEEFAACRQFRKFDASGNDIMQEQAYRKFYSSNNGLYWCGCLVRRKSGILSRISEQWWEHLMKYTWRDQISFPVVCHLNKFTPLTFKEPLKRYVNWHSHNHEMVKRNRIEDKAEVIRVYIPLETKQIIPPEVLRGIKSQTVASEIVECRSPGITDSQRNPHYHQYEAVSRNLALDLIKSQTLRDEESAYTIMQDSDIQHLRSTNFAEMIAFLDNKPEWGGVGLYQGPVTKKVNLEPRHVRLSCIILRNELWNFLRFDVHAKSCLCIHVSETIRKAGFRFGFLDADNRRIKEILDRDKRYLSPEEAIKVIRKPTRLLRP
jgi:hypothetical protein